MKSSNVFFKRKYDRTKFIQILVFQFTSKIEEDWFINPDDNLYYLKESPHLQTLIEKVLRKALDKGVNLVVFPELSVPKSMLEKITSWSQTNNITVIAGSHYQSSKRNAKPFNTCPIICNGEVKYVSKKIWSKFEEEKISCYQGDFPIFRNTPIGDFCVFICSDYLYQGHETMKALAHKEKLDFWIVPAFQPHAEAHITPMSSDVRDHDDLASFIIYCNNKNEFADGQSSFFGDLHNDKIEEYKTKGITDYDPRYKAISPVTLDWDYFIVKCNIESKRPYAGSRVGDNANIKFIEKGKISTKELQLKTKSTNKKNVPLITQQINTTSFENSTGSEKKADWNFHLKLGCSLTSNGFCTFNSKLRIPVSGSILLSKEIRDIIDTPEFQRLRGVRQLGPTMFVFPGANHTRFEHSLGVYSLALQYIEKLTSLPDFHLICDDVDKTIKLILICSLLHDIGHYPYSHWIEEIIGSVPQEINLSGHEDRVWDIIEKSELKILLTNVWGLDIKDVTDIISSRFDEERKDLKLVNSIINSVCDIDKLDYLKRDSVHCGINYGISIDTDRLLDSIYIDTDFNSVSITEKGIGSIMSIISARNIMYESVYWHKTVRGAEAMFKRCFYELSQFQNVHTELENLLNLPDDEFISSIQKLIQQKNIKPISDMIKPFAFQGRKYLYKPAYVYFERNHKNNTTVRNYFNKMFGLNKFDEVVKESIALTNRIKQYIPEIGKWDILIEKTPVATHENPDTQDFRLFNTRTKKHQDLPMEIKTFNNYLNNNKQAYIFCNPEYYDKLLNLFEDPKVINVVFK